MASLLIRELEPLFEHSRERDATGFEFYSQNP
jgi:hypothetical protein